MAILGIAVATPLLSGFQQAGVTAGTLVAGKLDYAAEVKELAPIVEAITARKFTSLPPVRGVTQDELVESLKTDEDQLAPQAARVGEPELGEQELLRELTYLLHGANLLARYSTSAQAILVSEDNLKLALERSNAKPEDAPGMVRLVLAHELTHALQDQTMGLRRLVERHRARHKLHSVDAAIEGFALVVQDEAARRLGLERAAGLLQKVMPVAGVDEASTSRSDDPAARRRGAARKLMQVKFMTSGPEAMWSALQDPPEALEFAPSKLPTAEELRAIDGGDAKFQAVLNGLAEKFKLKGTASVITGAPPAMSLQPFKVLPNERRVELLGLCRAVHALMCVGEGGKDTPEVLALTIYELRPDADKRKFIGAIEELGEATADVMRVDGLVSVAVTETAGIRLDSGVSARSREIAITLGRKSLMTMESSWTSWEGCVILLTTTYRLPTTTAYGLIDETARRLGAVPQDGTAPPPPPDLDLSPPRP